MIPKDKREPIFVPTRQKEPWIISTEKDPDNPNLTIVTIDKEEYDKTFQREIVNILKKQFQTKEESK